MSVVERPDGLELALEGEIDIAVADELHAAGARALAVLPPGARLNIDMAAVRFIDSSGIGALVSIRNAATPSGSTVALLNTPTEILRLFELTGLLESFMFLPATV